MRIIAGQYKGRKLTGVKGMKIRPTLDRIRESLFSILSQKTENALVLDLFAGTGALGLEALSRGAAQSFFIDKSKEAIKIINKNIELLNIKDRTEVLLHDASHIGFPKVFFKNRFDLIFMDPPYNKGLIANMLGNVDLLNIMGDDSIIIAEHSIRENDFEKIAGFDLYDKRTYGETLISFFKKKQVDS
jgi:16S rRNA (guanine966-N2)-methyltransferase